MPKVSVIIPVYNVEEYLDECLVSVINQTEKDIEIICVDDCSTDSSLEILQEYAKKDERIVILQNEVNSGQSVARNKGLDLAQGEYVLFVDSDDFIEPALLEITLKYAENVDMVCFDYWECNNKFSNQYNHVYSVADGLYNKYEYFVSAVNSNSIIHAPWSRIYKRKFLIENDIRFVQGIIYEDILFSFECNTTARRIYNINKKLYQYRIRPNSIMTQRIKRKNLNDHFYSLYKVTELYITNEYSFELSLAIEKFIKNIANTYKEMYKKYNIDNGNFYELFENEMNLCSKLQRIFSDYFIGCPNDIVFSTEQLEDIVKCKNIVVYGAGDIAQKVISYLDLKNISINGIAVSNTANNRKSLMCNPVRALSEYSNIKDECLVIIAVTSKFSGEIEKNLKEQGFKNYIKLF